MKVGTIDDCNGQVAWYGTVACLVWYGGSFGGGIGGMGGSYGGIDGIGDMGGLYDA